MKLIRFCLFDNGSACNEFIFCGLPLRFSSSVIHLGNKLTYNLLDNDDKFHQLSWAANGLFASFGFIDPVSLIYFSHTVWLFMVVSCGSYLLTVLSVLEVAFNNYLQRILSLPTQMHTSISSAAALACRAFLMLSLLDLTSLFIGLARVQIP